MLNSIYIKNFAIIDELFVEFDKGLNIITGETGSGKTLLVKAIQLILGKRFSREMLKSGKDSIILEGIFNYKDKDIIIRRIYKNNKSRTFIDDTPVSTNKLKSLSNKLADLLGQHDNQNILNTDMHINYLDAYGDYFDKITLYQEKMNKLNDLQKELTNFSKLKEDYLSDLELKEFQIEELTMYPLTQDTYQEVIEKHNFISQSVQIKNSINFIIELIDRSNSSIIKNINQINKEFLKIIKYDDKLETIYDRLESSRINIEDINIEIDNYINRFHINDSEIKKGQNFILDVIVHLARGIVL